jgi:hypothetical protein
MRFHALFIANRDGKTRATSVSPVTLCNADDLFRVQADRHGEGQWKEWAGKSGAHGLRNFSFTIFKRVIT